MKLLYTKSQRKEIYLEVAAEMVNTGKSLGLCIELGNRLPGGFFVIENDDIYKEFPEVFKYISPFYENQDPSKDYLPIPLFWFDKEGFLERRDIRILILLFAAEMI